MRTSDYRLWNRFMLGMVAVAVLLSGVGFGQQTFNLSAPPPPPVSQAGAAAFGTPGAVTLYYWVAARYPAGMAMPYGPVAVPRTVGAANLNGSNFVRIGWTPVASATGYYVIRTTTPTFPMTGTCTGCVVLANSTARTFDDTGGGTTNYPPAGVVNPAPAASGYITLDNTSRTSPFVSIALNNVLNRIPLADTAFAYGLDLRPQGPYSVADIRGQNGDTITNSAVGTWTLSGGWSPAGDVTIPAANALVFTGRSKVKSSANGFLTLFNNAETGFTGLRFGGVTNLFPMWKSNGAVLEGKLADDSAYTPINGLDFNAYSAAPGYYFGSALATHPALKRDGTAVSVRLADDTNFAPVNGLDFNAYSAAPGYFFGSAAATHPALKRDGTSVAVRLADDSLYGDFKVGKSTVYNSQATAGVGQPYILGVYSQTALTGDVASGNLAAAPGAGMYRVSAYGQTTTVAGGACTATLTIGWTYNAIAKTNATITIDLNTGDALGTGSMVFLLDAAANITREVTTAGGGCNPVNQRYDLTLVAERLN